MCTSQETTCERMVLEYTYKSKSGYPWNILNTCQVIDMLTHNTHITQIMCWKNVTSILLGEFMFFSSNITYEIIFKCTYKIKLGILQNVQKNHNCISKYEKSKYKFLKNINIHQGKISTCNLKPTSSNA
jgi:hypothetical protein